VHLALIGRNLERLTKVAKECEAKGSTVSMHQADVVDRTLMTTTITQQDEKTPFDIIIANAGISPLEVEGMSLEESTRTILSTNIDGVVNTIFPPLEAMKTRKKGQIVIMSSLASYMAINGSYGGSKSAVRALGETLRSQLKYHNIGVTVLCPGFIKTPMTAKSKRKLPGLIDLEPAMQIMFKAIKQNKAVVAFPRGSFYMAWIIHLLPADLRIVALNYFAGLFLVHLLWESPVTLICT